MEFGLTQQLRTRLNSEPCVDLASKIDEAERLGLISSPNAAMAHQVRGVANRVLHKSTATEEQAFEVLPVCAGYSRICIDRARRNHAK